MSEEFTKLLNIKEFREVIKGYINQEIIEFHLFKSLFYTKGITIRVRQSNYDFYNFDDIETKEFENIEFYNMLDILQDFKIYKRNLQISKI